jgi:LmbE family N-acetylglucosaminyl deacetylase
MTHSYQHVYLSPHYDDASLSCGGAIHQQTQAGESVLVVTVCAAPPPADEPFSALAQKLHVEWGNPADVIVTRQAEDKVSMAILGADYVRLNFTDGLYRGQPRQGKWYYNSGDDLFRQIHPQDLALVGQIVAALQELAPVGAQTTVYAPLGVGNHVDHQLTRAAAKELRQQGWCVVYYEDYPYTDLESRFVALRPGHYTLEVVLAEQQAERLQAQLCFLAAENLQAKIESIRAYASQLTALFGDAPLLEEQVQRFALWVGQGKLAERLWVPG